MRSSSPERTGTARILLVDDNRLGLIARKSLLEESGYQITTAFEGNQALELFDGGRFDLMITDYKMPRMDGIRLIEHVRKRVPQLPIILVSGYADALGFTESSTGADVVIAKSATEVTHLLRAVARLLRKPAVRKPPSVQASRAKVKRQGA